MTSKKTKKVLRVISNLITFVCVLFIIWGILSFIDVNMHNTLLYPSGPSDWNLFKILIDWKETL